MKYVKSASFVLFACATVLGSQSRSSAASLFSCLPGQSGRCCSATCNDYCGGSFTQNFCGDPDDLPTGACCCDCGDGHGLQCGQEVEGGDDSCLEVSQS